METCVQCGGSLPSVFNYCPEGQRPGNGSLVCYAASEAPTLELAEAARERAKEKAGPVINVTQRVADWKNLVAALRAKFPENPNGPQLGRLAWMTVGAIEAAIADFEKRETQQNGNGGESSADAGAGPAREGEVVQ